jgi:serine phosphatase RsbU (regulator of sigma subunit)
MKLNLKIFVLFLNISFYVMNANGHSQQQVIDSLLKILSNTKNDSNLLRLNLSLGIEFKKESKFTDALNRFNIGLKLAESTNEKYFQVEFLTNIGKIYTKFNLNDEAILLYDKAVIISSDLSDSVSISNLYMQMGFTRSNAKHSILSIDCYKKAIKIYIAKNDKKNVRWAYNMIALSYQSSKDLKNAEIYFQKCYKLSEELTDSWWIRGVLANIGNIYLDKGDYLKSIEIQQKAIKLAIDQKDNFAIGWSQGCIAKSYLKLNDIRNAKEYGTKYLKEMYEANSKWDIMDAELLLSQIDSARNDGNAAYIHFKNYITLLSELRNEEITKTAINQKFQIDYENQRLNDKVEQEKKEILANNELKRQKLIRNSFILGFIIVLCLSTIIYRQYTLKQKSNIELGEKNNLILAQKHLVEEKQKEITDSINYAQRLQQAILPPKEFIGKHILNNFILYKPKDIVAGDFYWAEEIGNLFFIAAADSTGHGVPGAMVSVVCSNALNRAVKEFGFTETGKILDKTRELVVDTFAKSNAEVKDGMDISLLCVNKQNQRIFWSGANNPIWFVQDNELKEIKADKQPIGKTDNPKPFTTHQLEYKVNTTFYLFTDGLADQFGGPKGKKFKYKQFEDLLIAINDEAMQVQSTIINEKFEAWKNELEQVDDVCVIGIKI